MKKWLILISLFFICNVKAYSIELYSKSAIVYDVNLNEVLFNKSGNEVLNVASLTKIATAIVAIENNSDLDKEVVINYQMLSGIRSDASVVGLKIGDKVTIRDLLYGTLLPSGADAAHSLAVITSGNINDFVDKMNELAINLGLINTHFVNVSGLDAKNHQSTAYEMTLLLKYALKNKVFKEIFTTKNYTMLNGKEIKTTIYFYSNDGKINVSRIIGSKTGYTNGAGLCLATYFKSKDHELISIVLGAPIERENPKNVVDTLGLIEYADSRVIDIEKKIKEKNELVKLEIKRRENHKRKEEIFITSLILFISLSLFCGFITIFLKI